MAYPRIDSFANAPSAVHDPASLQFLPRQVAPSYSHYPISPYNSRSTQAQIQPPPLPRHHPSHSHSAHPHTRTHGSANSQRSFDRPVPQALLDDPAFSTDPRLNPQFHSVASNNFSARPPRPVTNYFPDSHFPPNNDTTNPMWPPHGASAVSAFSSRPYSVVPAPTNYTRVQYPLPPLPPSRAPTVNSVQNAVYPPAPAVPFPHSEIPPKPRSHSSVSSSSHHAYPGIWRPPTHSMYSDSESSSGSPISLPRSLPSSSASSSASLTPSPHQSQNTTPGTSREPSRSPADAAPPPKNLEVSAQPPPYTEFDELSLTSAARPEPPHELVETQVLVPVGPTLVPEEALTSAPVQMQPPVVIPPTASIPFPQAPIANRPSLNARYASAPTIPVQPPVEPPARPATTPAAAVPQNTQTQHQHHVLQRKRSRKQSATSTIPELPRIEEADELASQDPLDPLGFAWRMAGPYELAGPGVSRSKSKANLKAEANEQDGGDANNVSEADL